jgi:hypothetical protein
MARMKDYLAAWVKDYREAMSRELHDLITMAKMDLYFGPYYEEDDPERPTKWPGFITACKRIYDALDDIPSRIWVAEYDPECWQDLEPDTCAHECGEEPPDGMCNGAHYGDFYQFDRAQLIEALLGKELIHYVR